MRKATLIHRAVFAATVVISGRIVRATPVFSTLVTFNNTNGANPFSTLISDSSGNLYGTTNENNFGSENGTVFKLPVRNYSSLITLATFNKSNGSRPEGSIAVDPAGDIFGTTDSGGSAFAGVVYAVNGSSGAITDLTTFTSTNGSFPTGGVTPGPSGTLYGTTSSGGGNGGGTVFKIPDDGSATETTLQRFVGGSAPSGRLVVDSSGDVFGTTSGVGTSGYGTVFEIPASTGVPVTLVAFNSSNGTQPGDLISDSAGNLYGTTKSGGQYGYGTIYEIQVGNLNVIDTLASFNAANGSTPTATLLIDAARRFIRHNIGGGIG